MEYTNDEKENIINDYQSGMPLKEMSQKYNICDGSIFYRLKKWGIKLRGQNVYKFTEEDKIQIINDYNNDVKLIDIGARYGVSGDSITRYLRIWGIPERDGRKYKFTENDYMFLEQEYAKGNWNAIFERFPYVSHQNIRNMMYSRGISQDSYFWSEHDKNILLQYYGNLSTKQIKLMLEGDYKVKTIQCKAKKLGLTESREWTDEELYVLQSHYSQASREELCKLLPRKTDNAISIKARQLNLVSLWKIEHLYTEEEDRIINDNWETMSDKEIGELIGRDWLSVKTRRKNLGLKREYGKSSYGTLVHYIRMNIYDWKRDSMEKSNYKCVITGGEFDDIHHIQSFHLMLKETLGELGLSIYEDISSYSDDQLNNILKRFKDVQSRYPLGVCLRRDVHILFHNLYGRGNNTPEQWNEFFNDCKKNKYVNIINN